MKYLVYCLEIPDADEPVSAHSQQLPLVHDELLNGTHVTGPPILLPNLHFDQTPVPQQHVALNKKFHHKTS